MDQDPWLVVFLFGAAIAGIGWMLPKTAAEAPDAKLASEAAYDRLLEDLEAENRELLDAVAKFKQEQDATVERLGRRIRDLEQQMTQWTAERAPAAATPSGPPQPPAPAAAESGATPEERASEQAAVASEPPDGSGGGQAAEAAPETAPPATSMRSRYPELMRLHDGGRSVEQIAKALQMNKGEVQLILQLARREDVQRA